MYYENSLEAVIVYTFCMVQNRSETGVINRGSGRYAPVAAPETRDFRQLLWFKTDPEKKYKLRSLLNLLLKKKYNSINL